MARENIFEQVFRKQGRKIKKTGDSRSKKRRKKRPEQPRSL